MNENTATPDDDAARAGADVEVPSSAAPAEPHTTRTLADVDPNGDEAPLTTDREAQTKDSIVNPGSS